jgi:hypothetical protein
MINFAFSIASGAAFAVAFLLAGAATFYVQAFGIGALIIGACAVEMLHDVEMAPVAKQLHTLA